MLTLHAASEEIRQGGLSPEDLLERCLGRVDRYEGRVRAWVLVDRERARAEAAERADELRRGHWRGPLHGIPVGVKDIFDVFDWPTAAGSRLWRQSVARHDATAVRRLREAGAVLVGKTVTTQYASFDPSPTRNPWDGSRTPGGSSSGSAAAVACGTGLGALASQTGGSTTRPAAYCGVASLKPTWGRVSTFGVVPLAPSLDHVGFMAPSVRDLAPLFQATAGPDPLDPAAAANPVPDVLAALGRPPHPPRLGRVRGLFERLADSAMTEMVDRAAATLTAAGARVQDVTLPGSFDEVLARQRKIMAVEAAAYHGKRLRRHPDDYGPCVTALLEEGLACTATEYAACRKHQLALQEEMAGCFTGIDALLMPATTTPPPDAATTGDPALNSPWSHTGLPVVSLVAGWTPGGLPLAVQLVGPAWGEADLLVVAAWCEDALAVPAREPAA
jgi:aspartyl-tRNA(Asn)/glutamyl-tRNA(Gln) amidotransferase subunit A